MVYDFQVWFLESGASTGCIIKLFSYKDKYDEQKAQRDLGKHIISW